MAKVTEPKVATLSDEPEVDTPPQEGSTKTEATQTVFPAHIEYIFKACPQYDKLWIDREGGIFASKPEDSPTAILYQKTAE